MKRVWASGMVLVAPCLLAGQAFADIAGTGGLIQHIMAPPSVVFGALESNLLIRSFDEAQDVTLFAALAANITLPGSYGGGPGVGPLTPGLIPQGTRVRSHFLHFDTRADSSQSSFGTITFDADILGIIVSGPTLNNTDALLGAPGTAYPTHIFRGLELNTLTADRITFQPDLRTLTVNIFNATVPGDQIRVITAVPAPASLLLAAWGLAALGRIRHRAGRSAARV